MSESESDLLPCDPRRTAPLTLPAALDRVAALAGGAVITFPDEDERLTVAELADRARTAAAALVGRGVRPGDRVGVLAPNAPEFLVALFGVVRAGAAAAPLALPMGSDVAEWAGRLDGVLQAAGARHVVVSHRIADRVAPALATVPGVAVVNSADLAEAPAHDAIPLPAAGDAAERSSTPTVGDAAIVQFTSGSTARPKGVVLTHANVWHCARSITEAIALEPDDVHGSWLPLFHDMGLFGALTGLFRGIPLHLWSPAGFVRRPARWLASFAAARATIATMPNFGYDTLVDAVGPDEAADLDLSAWRVAFNGAEAVSAEATARFLARFAAAGFRPETMVPAYGMAEVTLVATLPPQGRAPVVEHVDRAALSERGVAVPVADDAGGARALVGLGRAVPGMAVRVAAEDTEDTDGAERADGEIGEIQLRGPMATTGYLHGGDDLFTAGGWLRTGDLGYLRHGELFFAGRRKEMVTVAGRNLYCADVEELVRDQPGVHKGRVVALAGVDPDGRERVELVVEAASGTTADPTARAELVARLRARVVATLGALPLVVLPVPPRTIPRTTSGKLRRLDTRSRIREVTP